MKKYRVNNDNTDDTELDENARVFQLVIQPVLVMYQLLFRYVLIVVFFESVYQIMTQMHASCNGFYDGEQRLVSIIIQAKNDDVCQMEINDDNKDYLSNRDVDAWLHYFVNPNNGEIPEDELNYQTSKINSTEATSAMKWKGLVRRLRSDMNNEYHEETGVVVQVIMPNDHSKQDQHNQRKQLKRCDHTYTNKEDHIETRDDDETKVGMYMDDHLKQGVQSNRHDSLKPEQNYCFSSINRINYDEQDQSDRNPSLPNDDVDSGNDNGNTHSFTIDDTHSFTNISEPASRYDSQIKGIPTAAVAAELN